MDDKRLLIAWHSRTGTAETLALAAARGAGNSPAGGPGGRGQEGRRPGAGGRKAGGRGPEAGRPGAGP